MGVPILLQIQNKGFNVAKALRAKGRADLIDPSVVAATVEKVVNRPNKYGVSAAELRTMDGIVFDSKREMCCYRILRDSGVPFTRQVEFVLQDSYVDADGKKVREIRYKADFLLGPCRSNPLGPLLCGHVVIDVKGMKTEVYKLKKKMFELKFGKQITEIRTDAEMANLIHANKTSQWSGDLQPPV